MALETAMKRQPNLSKWICHIRQRLVDRRLSLLTGAGVSMECGAPSWDKLVEGLAEDVPGFSETFARHRAAGLQDTVITQFIHSRFIDDYLASRSDVPESHIQLRAGIEWYAAIRKRLYKDIPPNVDELKAKHPYIEELAKLCVRCLSTITFNFDDLLDQIASSVTPDFSLPPKTTWHLPMMDSPTMSYIYHINGLLPQLERKKASERLTFTEDSFLQVIYGERAANNAVLSNFTNATFLLVGVSLKDHSLKSILATNAMRSPGSIHYIVNWLSADDALSAEERDDITRANFETYNLVTIFLTSVQIAEFLSLVQRGVDRSGTQTADALDESFASALRRYAEDAPVRFKYYIAGPVASGKSTLLENLRAFRTMEEWPEKTPAELYQDHSTLSDEQRRDVDEWILRQLKIKNRLFAQCCPGIHVMDRAPLDLFAFSVNESQNVEKANDIKKKVENDGILADGEVLLVVASASHLVERQLKRGRIPRTTAGGLSYDEKGLQAQRDELERTYPGARLYSTDDCAAHVLAKRVMHLIMFGEYRALDLNALNEQRRVALVGPVAA